MFLVQRVPCQLAGSRAPRGSCSPHVGWALLAVSGPQPLQRSVGLLSAKGQDTEHWETPDFKCFHPDVPSPHASLVTAGHMATPSFTETGNCPSHAVKGKGKNRGQGTKVMSTLHSLKLINNNRIPQVVFNWKV